MDFAQTKEKIATAESFDDLAGLLKQEGFTVVSSEKLKETLDRTRNEGIDAGRKQNGEKYSLLDKDIELAGIQFSGEDTTEHRVKTLVNSYLEAKKTADSLSGQLQNSGDASKKEVERLIASNQELKQQVEAARKDKEDVVLQYKQREIERDKSLFVDSAVLSIKEEHRPMVRRLMLQDMATAVKHNEKWVVGRDGTAYRHDGVEEQPMEKLFAAQYGAYKEHVTPKGPGGKSDPKLAATLAPENYTATSNPNSRAFAGEVSEVGREHGWTQDQITDTIIRIRNEHKQAPS